MVLINLITNQLMSIFKLRTRGGLDKNSNQETRFLHALNLVNSCTLPTMSFNNQIS